MPILATIGSEVLRRVDSNFTLCVELHCHLKNTGTTMPACDGNYCLHVMVNSLEVKIETDSNDAVEIKTEAESNVTECSYDGGTSIGMFGFVTFICLCVM